jgi:hypothetical protein
MKKSKKKRRSQEEKKALKGSRREIKKLMLNC